MTEVRGKVVLAPSSAVEADEGHAHRWVDVVAFDGRRLVSVCVCGELEFPLKALGGPKDG